MKRIIVMVLVLSLFGLPLIAQTSFGLKGSLSDYNFVGSDWDDFVDFAEASGYSIDNEFSLSFSLGGFLELGLSQNLSIQPELLFTLASMKYGDGTDWMKETWKMIEVPVYLKGYLPIDNGSLYGMAGPDIFYLLGDVDVEDSDGATGSSTADNSLLLGFAVSAGYETEQGISIGLKYSRVLKEYTDNVEIYIQGIGVEGGIKF